MVGQWKRNILLNPVPGNHQPQESISSWGKEEVRTAARIIAPIRDTRSMFFEISHTHGFSDVVRHVYHILLYFETGLHTLVKHISSFETTTKAKVSQRPVSTRKVSCHRCQEASEEGKDSYWPDEFERRIRRFSGRATKI